jgi:zinc transport system permease protein
MMDFLWRAVIAGLLLAIAAGPLGCFIVWRRMAYFGDTLAHSALLGISIGLLLELNLTLTVLITAASIAGLLLLLERKQVLASDTALGILAHASLALGLVTLSLSDLRVDLMAYLFGDLLAVGVDDLLWLGASCGFTLFLISRYWRSLISVTLHQELAQVEGLPVSRLRMLMMMMLALMVAVAMKVVGILLITALLVIPPATARFMARSPLQMAVLASTFGMLAVLTGIAASWWLDTPTGPSIVVAAGLFFAAVNLTKSVN